MTTKPVRLITAATVASWAGIAAGGPALWWGIIWYAVNRNGLVDILMLFDAMLLLLVILITGGERK